jgi:hypothetical protein
MAFRNPVTTVSGVDTGGNGARVVITETGGTTGGGAVLLYPDANTDAGELRATADMFGPTVVLESPRAAPLGLGTEPQPASSLQLRSMPAGADLSQPTPGVRLDSTARVVVNTPAGQTMWVNGQPIQPARRAWTYPRPHTTTFQDFTAGGTMHIIQTVSVEAPAGVYLAGMALMLQHASTSNGNVRWFINGDDVLDGLGVLALGGMVAQPTPNTYTHPFVHPGGTLAMQSQQSATAGGNFTVLTNGTGMSLAYLGGTL